MENNTSIQNLTRKERREIERQHKRENSGKDDNKIKIKKVIRRSLIILFAIAMISGIVWIIMTPSKRPNLPPTTMQGHIESNPSAHIVTEPIPDPVQRHMLEHADGKVNPESLFNTIAKNTLANLISFRNLPI